MLPVTRERSEGDRLSRHLVALRARLDYLVRMEDRCGEEQDNLHRNRAERNALIYALHVLAPAEAHLGVPLVQKVYGPKHDREYVQRTREEIGELLTTGYTRVDEQRPGVVLHKNGDDVAPVEVSLTVWFGMLMAGSAA